MGSSPKPQTQNTVTEPWKDQQPYLKTGFEGALDLYNQGAPAYYSGSTVANQSSQTGAANSAIQNLALNGNPAVNAGQSQLMSTINGDYLNSNPYLDAMYNKASSRVVDSYNQIQNPGIDSQYSLGGRLGQNAAYATTRGTSDQRAQDQLNDLATQIYGGNYATERQNQLGATNTAAQYGQNQMANLGALQGVGQYQDAYGQMLTDADIARYDYGAQAPYNNLANYMGLIQGNYGGSSTSTASAQKQNPLSQALGLGLTGAQLYMMSDINTKENIEHIGTEKGHQIYEFSYKGMPNERYTGVIAQNILETNPDAVIKTDKGLMVDYGMLGITMKRVT
jgi:hypothetical protein